MLALTALAAIYQAYERRHGRLLPVVEHDSLRGVEPADEEPEPDADAEPVLQN